MMKKIGLIIVSVVAVLAVVGVVSAQEQTPAAPPAPVTPGRGLFGAAGREPVLGDLLQLVADDLGVQPQDILQQMRGKTLADVIADNGGDLNQITADVTAAVTERINQAVTDGSLTQERADQILGSLDDAVQRALSGNGALAQLRDRLGGRPGLNNGRGQLPNNRAPFQQLDRPFVQDGVRPLLNAATDATGLTAQELGQELRSGKSLSDVITENGGDPATVVSDALAAAKTQLDEAVTNGRLTQDQEDAIVNGLQALYDAFMNNTFTPRQPASTGTV